MANSFRHKSAGMGLTRTEYEAEDAHQCDDQAIGDMLVAVDSTHLERLPKGTTGQVLTVGADGMPYWATP